MKKINRRKERKRIKKTKYFPRDLSYTINNFNVFITCAGEEIRKRNK
jgi:hypothetical protein